MPQLIKIAFHSGMCTFFKFPYQATVIKIFENKRSIIVHIIKKE